MNIFPGKAIFSPPKPKDPEPLPPVPVRPDPVIAENKAKLNKSLKRRRGRASSILTSGKGVDDIALGNNASAASPVSTVLG